MAAPDRAKDARRTVGSHEKMMGALGRAAGWKRAEGFALSNKDIFRPGHGNVDTGSRNYYEPTELATPRKTIGRYDATKGVNKEE